MENIQKYACFFFILDFLPFLSYWLSLVFPISNVFFTMSEYGRELFFFALAHSKRTTPGNLIAGFRGVSLGGLVLRDREG